MWTLPVNRVYGIVLQVTPWRDKDRKLVLLTKERGKIIALAQGAMRPQNRLTSVAQIGAQAWFWLARGRELERIVDTRVEQIPYKLRQDVNTLTAFSITAELLTIAMPFEATDEGLFNEFLWLCECLMSNISPLKWLATVQIRLLWRLGWAPRLVNCAICGAPLTNNKVIFAPSAGGSLCEKCTTIKSPPDSQVYPKPLVQALHSLMKQPKLLTTLNLRQALWMQALSLERTWLCYYIETDLKSWRVWGQLHAEVQPTTRV